MPKARRIKIFVYYFFANENSEGVAHSLYWTLFCATKTRRHQALLMASFCLVPLSLCGKIKMSSSMDSSTFSLLPPEPAATIPY
jgi:hypothetical protein